MVNVSVIVPVYNTEKYLRQCLDSLVAQTLEKMEIILVNDGSTDQSGLIIDEYRQKYPDRIVVVSKENGGLSDARNEGMKRASGEYIGFVDSDDWVSPTMFKALYDKAHAGQFDIVNCDVTYEYFDHVMKVSSYIDADLFEAADLKLSLLTIYPVACNKIFRLSLFENGIQFRKGVWYEDFEFLYRLYPQIRSIGTVKQALYHYRQSTTSIMHTYDKRLYQFVTNFDSIIEYYRTNNYYDEYKNELEFLMVRYAFATFIKRLAKARQHTLFIEGYDFAVRMVKHHFPDYKQNKYLKHSGLKGYYLLFFNRLISEIVYLYESSPVSMLLRKEL